ncbi:effector protein [Candidatus Phytoplasma citri]|uniref:Effector protein n=1 Tax=Candidatus Phytoplasma citri TaxID=180978 RepID=A0A1S9LZ16_9MOLU|nr:effector protein [Candidatus Phytoplasma aurantifolia]OOP58073.1 effector protein [Candidatus Phytoplasma aurantifolia]
MIKFYFYLYILFIFVKISTLNNIIIAAPPQDEFINGTRIVNVIVASGDILKKHNLFKQYFDWSCEYPSYNSELEEFGMIWKIKNPPENLLGVFFDAGNRDDADNKYTLEELKYIANKAKNMYIFWRYKEK